MDPAPWSPWQVIVFVGVVLLAILVALGMILFTIAW